MSKVAIPVSANSVLKPVEETLVYNPMYMSHENVWMNGVTYEEIALGGFRGGGVASKKFSFPSVFSRSENGRAEDLYKLQPYAVYRKPRRYTCYHVVCLTSSFTLLLSIGVLILASLIIFEAIPLPSGSRFPASTSSPTMLSSCNCTCYECEETPTPYKLLSQELASVGSELQTLSVKGQDHWREAMQRVENLTQQVEQIGSAAAQPPSMMGLATTVQIDIDMSAGCTNTTSSQEINLYKSVSGSVKYIDETYVITDFICEVEMVGDATLYGAGVIEVVRGSTSKNSSVFQYLSEVDVFCNCYYWAPNQGPTQSSGAFCTQVVTRCPYKEQTSIIHSLVS